MAYYMESDGSIPAVQAAAKFAYDVQDAVNLRAITDAFVKHLDNLRGANVYGDALNNHPVVLAFISKLNSLTRMTDNRTMAALDACAALARGEKIEYEVIPL